VVPGAKCYQGGGKKLYLYCMRPDYDHKIFNDKRAGYFLLMEALAMDSL
jgi:hypothetical protein